MAGCTSTASGEIAAARALSNCFGVRPVTAALDLGLLRDLQCVVDVDAEVSHGTFQLGIQRGFLRDRND